MKWESRISILIVILILAWFDWRGMKRYPTKEKLTFVALLLTGSTLVLCNLPYLTFGPMSIFRAVFRPLVKMLE